MQLDFEQYALENREHLNRLEAKVDSLATTVHQIRSGDCMPRCAEAQAEIERADATAKAAHKRLDLIATRVWWGFTAVAGALLTIIVSLAKDLITKG